MKIGLPDPTPIGAARETGGALVKAPRTTPKKDIKVTRDNELGVALRARPETPPWATLAPQPRAKATKVYKTLIAKAETKRKLKEAATSPPPDLPRAARREKLAKKQQERAASVITT